MNRPFVAVLFLCLAMPACSKANPKHDAADPAAEPPASSQQAGDMPLLDNSSPPAADDPTAPRHTLRWVTRGGNNMGYDVFRAESENGPFRKLNGQLLPGSGSRYDEITRFEYVDKTIEPGKTYWYYVEAVDLMNQRSRFTPVQRVDPKPASAGAAKP